MPPEEVVDALVLSARWDIQGLNTSGRELINSLESVSRAAAKAQASGQASPFAEASRDIVLASRAFRQGSLDLEGLNTALQHAKIEFNALREAGYVPNERQLRLLNRAVEVTTKSLAQQAAVAQRTAQELAAAGRASSFFGRGPFGGGGHEDQFGKVARGADSMAAGIARARSGLAQMAVTSIGTSAALGQVAQGLLFIGGIGSTGIIAAALGIAVLSRVWDEITESSRKAKEATEENREALRRLREEQKGPIAQARGSFETQEADVRRLEAALRRVSQARELAGKSLVARPDMDAAQLFNTLLKEETRLTKELTEARSLLGAAGRAVSEAEAEAVRTRTELIKTLGRELAVLQVGEDAVRIAEAGAIGGPDAAELVRRIIAIKNRVQAEKDLEAAWREQNQFLKQLAKSIQDVTAASQQMSREWSSATFQATEKQSEAVADLRREFNRLVDAMPTPEQIHLEFNDKLRQQFDQAADAVSRLANTAGEVGLLGDELVRATDDALNLAAAIQEIQLTGDSFTNILGVAGAGIGLLGGLGQAVFGKDETQREHEAIQAQNENTLATERNTAAVERAQTGAGRAEALGRLRDIPPEVRAGLDSLARGGAPFGELATSKLNQILEATGSSLEELQQIAEANGIQLLDSKGRLVAGALDALNERLKLAAEAALTFRDDLASQARQREVEDKLGIGGRSDDPDVARAQRARENLLEGLALDPATEARIKALDLATVEGREAFLEFERDLFKRAKAGGLTDEELGAFENVDELAEALGLGADAVDALAEAAEEAANQLGDFNLPPGFKRSSLVFDTMPFGPSRPGDGAALPLPGVSRVPGGIQPISTTNVGGMTFNITAPDAKAAGDEVVRKLREIGLVQSGDTMQLGLR